MNVDRPHNIKPVYFHTEPQRKQVRIDIERRAWLPLTEGEARMLEEMSEDKRAEWFANLPLEDRMRRWTEAEEYLDELERKKNGN